MQTLEDDLLKAKEEIARLTVQTNAQRNVIESHRAFRVAITDALTELRSEIDATIAKFNLTPQLAAPSLASFGYGPGMYSHDCIKCGGEFIGDKRASICQSCAEAAMKLR